MTFTGTHAAGGEEGDRNVGVLDLAIGFSDRFGIASRWGS